MNDQRDAVARIIDPMVWHEYVNDASLPERLRQRRDRDRRASLRRADEILALLNRSSEEERLREALTRISAATADSTNSATLAQFRSWVMAVAETSLQPGEA